MKHNLIFSGSKAISLDQPEDKIIDEINSNLDCCYLGLVKVDSVKEADVDTVEIKVLRELPSTGYYQNGFLTYIDESIISGMVESCFVPGENQVVFPIIPLGECFFTPDFEFIKLFKHLINIATGEDVKQILITPTTKELFVRIEFSGKMKIPRRYQQDIMDLTGKYGDLGRLKGQTLNITLQDFSKICKRDQPKIAAYKGLLKCLEKTYGININLTSNKTK